MFDTSHPYVPLLLMAFLLGNFGVTVQSFLWKDDSNAISKARLYLGFAVLLSIAGFWTSIHRGAVALFVAIAITSFFMALKRNSLVTALLSIAGVIAVLGVALFELVMI